MKKRVNDKNMPIGKLSRIDDFLPPPEKLAALQETVKVTLSLTKSSVAFFKRKAKLHHTQYQKMLRQLVDQYTIHYS